MRRLKLALATITQKLVNLKFSKFLGGSNFLTLHKSVCRFVNYFQAKEMWLSSSLFLSYCRLKLI